MYTDYADDDNDLYYNGTTSLQTLHVAMLQLPIKCSMDTVY